MDLEKSALTVSQINARIKGAIDKDPFLERVLVKGEISNFKINVSGHVYFTLKDENAVIKCIMFKFQAMKNDLNLKDGDKVFVLGKTTIYPGGGYYQLQVEALKKAGIGDLHEKFEKLKQKLKEEGLFDPIHKKKIPLLPKVIGVVTSKTGAVIHDIENVATRRHKGIQIILYPVAVQGEGASKQIVEGINYFNEKKNVDVIIVGRGGGSMEDLWEFNEEIVVRAIYESQIPIIAAVGHDTDVTLTDFVSDIVAPTPSAAAEVAVPDLVALREQLETRILNITGRIREILKEKKLKVENMKLNIQKLSPENILTNKKIFIDSQREKLDILITQKLKEKRQLLEKYIEKLDVLNPLNTLKRGYTITKKEGKSISSKNELKKGDSISILFADGEKNAEIL